MALIKTTIDQTARTIKFQVGACGAVDLRLDQLDKDVLAYAIFHGLKQKVADAAASSAEPMDKFAAIEQMVAHLNAGGAWNTRSAGDGSGAGAGGLVLRAIAAIQGLSVDEMSERIDRLAERKQMTRRALLMKLAKQPDVQAKMAELRPAPKGAPDADGLLDELSGESDEQGEPDSE